LAANNKTQVVLNHDSSIIVSNGQQLYVTLSRFIRWSRYIPMSINFALSMNQSIY